MSTETETQNAQKNQEIQTITYNDRVYQVSDLKKDSIDIINDIQVIQAEKRRLNVLVATCDVTIDKFNSLLGETLKDIPSVEAPKPENQAADAIEAIEA